MLDNKIYIVSYYFSKYKKKLGGEKNNTHCTATNFLRNSKVISPIHFNFFFFIFK